MLLPEQRNDSIDCDVYTVQNLESPGNDCCFCRDAGICFSRITY